MTSLYHALLKGYIYSRHKGGEDKKRMKQQKGIKEIAVKKDQGLQFLEFVKQRNIPVVIDGNQCLYEEAELICSVFEDDSYMSDYIVNEKGYIAQVHLDKIQEKK